MANTPEDLVLPIHGTFAQRDGDRGTSWWQLGSVTLEQLRMRLPQGIRLPRPGEVFHWSGANSERARSKASLDLYQQLLKLESQSQPYHLVGHSHGGSVVWGALRLATLRRKRLNHLRSWTTVGTPFLHHRTRSALDLANLVNLALAILLLRPIYNVCVGLTKMLLNVFLGVGGEIVVASQDSAPVGAFLRTPLLRLAKSLGIAMQNTAEGVQLGSYDPNGNQSFFQYLFFTREGLVILLLVSFAAFVYLQLASFLLSPVLESLRIRAERRLTANAIQQFGARWLGIWSPNDEAINGLKATLGLSLTFVAPLVPRERVFLSDTLALLSRPYYWVLSPVFNWLIKPVANNLVQRVVVKSAQGNNRPTAEVIAVLPSPVLVRDETRFPPIPEALDRRIVEKADRFAGNVAPQLRQLLAEPSFTAGLERFGKALSGKELVHTSYFDHPEILQLLCLNMAWSRRDLGYAGRVGARKPELVRWFARFKSAVGEKIPPLPPPPDLGQSTPAHPRWLTPRRRRLDNSSPKPAISPTTPQLPG